MNIYQVQIEVTETYPYLVKAETEQEAEQQALKMAQATHSRTEFIEVYSCENLGAIAQQEEVSDG